MALEWGFGVGNMPACGSWWVRGGFVVQHKVDGRMVVRFVWIVGWNQGGIVSRPFDAFA